MAVLRGAKPWEAHGIFVFGVHSLCRTGILGIIAISPLPKTKESCLSGRFLSVTEISSAWRFIDGSVIDTVGAGGFLKLIEAEPVLYRLSVQWDVAFVVHRLLVSFLHDAR
jgi:hypothetical protein